MSVKKHYDSHLGNFYEWMVGDFDKNQAEQETYFVSKGIKATGNKRAIDLGAGHGLHTISLSNLGFEVRAVDFNQQLLASLSKRSLGRNIELIESDILTYLDRAEEAEVVLCMGDTLAHIPSFEQLESLIEKVYTCLVPGGLFISSFRDYQFELEGTQRFIPVKSDDSRILTCFLEYRQESVLVTDLLHERVNDAWIQKASNYEKLRIGVEKVTDIMQNIGFSLQSTESIRRMNYLIVKK